MTDVLTLAHLEEMRRTLDSAAVPVGERIVLMPKVAFKDWCEGMGLDETKFKVKYLDNEMVEVYV